MIHDSEGNFVYSAAAPQPQPAPLVPPAPPAWASKALSAFGLFTLIGVAWVHVLVPLHARAIAHRWPVVSIGARLGALEAWRDRIDPPTPTPTPNPNPNPGPVMPPVPGPPPAPKPALPDKLNAVLLYPANAAPALASDPTIAPALAPLGVSWFTAPDLDRSEGVARLLPVAGSLPSLLVYDLPDANTVNFRDLAGAVVPRSAARIEPPADVAALIAAFKKLRGK